MCGIAGIFAPGRDLEALGIEVGRAIERLGHRGPDDRGVWCDVPGIALGHARLSILDLSELGHQPMSSRSGRFFMSFNGEIYNFGELRKVLEAEGAHFRGCGDSEVILEAFERWGSRAVDRFIGMFAIALWDSQERTLELYRDRLGVKPLYYREVDGGIVFASELKAIRAFAGWDGTVDRVAMGEYFQYGYIAGARTIYRDVRKLEPGHRLVKRQGTPLESHRYWHCSDFVEAREAAGKGTGDDELEELLHSAFQYRMVSDVPVGVFLSGGVDSSLVTAILARSSSQPLRTFTIGFRGTAKDESPWARRVAEHCGARHTEYQLEATEALAIVRRWGSMFDEPFGDSSGIPTYLVSRLAREEVKVVLSADGGDELFSGYEVYASTLRRMQRLGGVPLALRRMGGRGLKSLLPDRLGPRGDGSVHKLHRLAGSLGHESPVDAMGDYLSYFSSDEVDRLVGGYRNPRRAVSSLDGSPIDQMSLWDIEHYLPEDILTKVDRMTMAVSLEGREPLLDHRIAEFAMRMQPKLRRGEFGGKSPLKRLLYRYVPRELVDRPKQGFSVPLALWLGGELRPLVDELLDERRIESAGLIDVGTVRKVKRAFASGNRALSSALWFLMAFELWREEWGGS